MSLIFTGYRLWSSSESILSSYSCLHFHKLRTTSLPLKSAIRSPAVTCRTVGLALYASVSLNSQSSASAYFSKCTFTCIGSLVHSTFAPKKCSSSRKWILSSLDASHNCICGMRFILRCAIAIILFYTFVSLCCRSSVWFFSVGLFTVGNCYW